MKVSRSTIDTAVTVMALMILLAALPAAIRESFETGRVYLFSQQFLDELPQRLTGPGKFRFILQPLVAILLGVRGGLGDARAGRPPYIFGLMTDRKNRREMFRGGLAAVRNLIAMGIVMDAAAQLLIYQMVHPGAALVVGPVLICVPYAAARALSNRTASLVRRTSGK